MDLLVWISQAMIPFLGWWIVASQIQKMAAALEKRWAWGENIQKDFLKSVLVSVFHVTPEAHFSSLEQVALPARIRLLWIGLRSLSFAVIYLLVFALWNLIPAPVFLMVGFVLFVGGQWWKPLKQPALFSLGMGLFLTGFEWLLQASSRLTQMPEESSWIFALSHNYFVGALIGVGVGFLIRMVTRFSGVAWWWSTQLLLSGILSLGASWGFLLGDFLAGLVEDFFRFSDSDIRLRVKIGFGAGAVALILSAPFQSLIMAWINGQYSVQLRMDQLAVMVFVFLLIESAIALTVFHFRYLKSSQK